MDWKDTVTTMTDKVFPGISHKIDNNLIGKILFQFLLLKHIKFLIFKINTSNF